MADDERPYRTDEAPPRTRAPNSASDPLAELARLIGQTDPFSEFGRDTTRRPAQARQVAAPVSEWPTRPAAIEYAPQVAAPAVAPAAAPQPEPHPYAAPNFGRQSFGGAPLATGNDLYQVENDAAGYQDAQEGGYDAYQQNGAQDQDQDHYDDAPPARRRVGVVAIAGIFALAVIGTAGAFGYRAIFGSSGSSLPPPVIKAETAPSKIMPSTPAKDAQPGKQITDRVNDRGQGERLVSREEQPVDIKDKAIMFPPSQDRSQMGSMQSAPPSLGSGVVGSEPKKIRTIAIHPDQMGAATADAMPSSPPAASAPPSRVTNIVPAKPPLPQPRVADVRSPSVPESEPAPVPRAQAPRPAPPQAAAPSNAPLSLNPNAPAARPASTRTAAVAPSASAPVATTGAAGGGFAVQVSSQRSEAEAQAAFRSLQSKYPDQLGGRQALVRRVDLGEKGVYYRAMVGPFGNGSEATSLCSSLKAAGGQCIIQKN